MPPPANPGFPLPPEDRRLSPYTGWTRAHWEAVADRLLDALPPFTGPEGAAVRPPGTPSWSGPETDGLEGFARAFLLLAVRLVGAGGADPANRTERWALGLAAGVRRGGPEAWPDITDCSQQIVEAASIAVGLHLSRPWLWDRLAPATQGQLVDWLSRMVGRSTRDNNHVLFQVVVEEFLDSLGALGDRTEIEAGLDRVDAWYRGDGWYQDGPVRRGDHRDDADGVVRRGESTYDAGERFDYYNAWGFHYYTLLWSRIAGPRGGARAAVYRQRLRAFLAQYVRLFGADGAPVHHGRSLSYRFACLAPVWLGAEEDATPLPPGLTRRLANATLRHFVRNGAIDERGLLPLGWYRPFRPSAQAYSGPGSPYAASKGFLGLLIPQDHPVWTAPEEELPVEHASRTTALPVPGFLVHATREDGLVRLLNHGSHYLTPPPGTRRDDPHYAKFAYSTRTGPEVGGAAREQRLDNHIALVSPGGQVSRRERIHRVGVTDHYAASWHRPRMDDDVLPADCRIDSVSVVIGAWEVRVHRVAAPAGHTIREGGYALADHAPLSADIDGTRATVRRGDGLVSAIAGLYGWTGAHVRHGYGSNAFGTRSAVPYCSAVTTACPDSTTAAVRESIHVSAVLLTARGGNPAHEVLPYGLSASVDGLVVRLELQGHRPWLIRPGTARPVVGGPHAVHAE
ncbi:DUF2264 domain-containing protein [Kitasatospora sp. SUK 42]|uniref:DUF2264 domain-containing protein n=1 Tax=Kitasatospora sp. SUK 42 TaxID=1588882 RepID=UPI0027E2E850|nr:DUF2264 domain-containing protein [Kitasatospora sp. SUK 42]